MKISVLKLFIKTCTLALIINLTLDTITTYLHQDINLTLCIGILQIIISILVGFIIRKSSQIYIFNMHDKRFCNIVALSAFTVTILIVAFPDLIAIPYVFFTGILSDSFSIDFVNFFDFISLSGCLITVFFNVPSRNQSL